MKTPRQGVEGTSHAKVSRPSGKWWLAMWGVGLVGALVLFHEPPVSRDADETPSARLQVHSISPSPLEVLALDARTTNDPARDPTTEVLWTTKGSRDAPDRLVVFLCPTCAACARLVAVLDTIADRHSDLVRIDIRFLPLWHACNDTIPQGSADAQHRHACALVRTALAVGQTQPEAFGDYLDWMFATNNLDESIATAEAGRRVDAESLAAARDSDLLWTRLREDMQLAHRFDVRTVPQLFVPRGQVVGGITVENLDRFLSEEFDWKSATYARIDNPQVWVASERIDEKVRLARRLRDRGQFHEAADAYRSALLLKPNWIDASLELAWLLATCTRADVRDGAESIRIVKVAEQTIDGMTATDGNRDAAARHRARLYDTMAAAYAESGDFDQAQSWARQAMYLHDRNQQPSEAHRAKERRAFYQRHEPYRE